MLQNLFSTEFCGFPKISDHGLKNRFVDYRTLAGAFDHVLANDLMNVTSQLGLFWDEVCPGGGGLLSRIEETENRLEELREQFEETGGEALSEEITALEKQAEELRSEEQELGEREVFQWYIVSNAGADILKDAGEILYYCETLDLYLWGVTHYGTSWDYVLTDIPCRCGEESATCD